MFVLVHINFPFYWQYFYLYKYQTGKDEHNIIALDSEMGPLKSLELTSLVTLSCRRWINIIVFFIMRVYKGVRPIGFEERQQS